jgi:hypothetical protein
MPSIEISRSLYERLQRLARPFEDTPESVVERLLDEHERNRDSTRSSSSVKSEKRPSTARTAQNGAVSFENAASPPDLTHTRILQASVDEVPVAHWNEMVHVAHQAAMRRLTSVDELIRRSESNAAKGRRSDRGFQFNSELGISIQNVDANTAWRHVRHLARQCGIEVEVNFQWADKEGASRPGKVGMLKTPSRP